MRIEDLYVVIWQILFHPSSTILVLKSDGLRVRFLKFLMRSYICHSKYGSRIKTDDEDVTDAKSLSSNIKLKQRLFTRRST